MELEISGEYENILKKIIIDLKTNSKVRSEQTVYRFKGFLKLFLEYFEINIDELFYKKKIITIEEEDIDHFIENRSESYIFFLSFIFKKYLDFEINPTKEINRFKNNLAKKELIRNRYKGNLKKDKGTEYLKINELEAIYNSTENNEIYKIFFLFFITTGMRIGGFKNCKYKNIN